MRNKHLFSSDSHKRDTITRGRDTGDEAKATIDEVHRNLISICHPEILQLISLVERRDPSDPTLLITVTKPSGRPGIVGVHPVYRDPTELTDQVAV